eukprot:Nitzschia sp. Nitz4//scaffold26_size159584//47708//49390//NITZ4_002481-RA/size159584-exonerate_est2genome-gene-0.105-mRNA-1//-1//CDS//3329545052//5670//frame0
MGKGERNEHDLAGMIVVNHTISQKLDDTRDDGRSDFAQSPGQMLSNDEFRQPTPAELCFGQGSTSHLKEPNFSVGDSSNDRERTTRIVSSFCLGGPSHTQEHSQIIHELLGASTDLHPFILVGIHRGPFTARIIKGQGRLGSINIIAQGGKGNGNHETGQMRQLLQEQMRSSTSSNTRKSLGWEFSTSHGSLGITKGSHGSLLVGGIKGSKISIQSCFSTKWKGFPGPWLEMAERMIRVITIFFVPCLQIGQISSGKRARKHGRRPGHSILVIFGKRGCRTIGPFRRGLYLHLSTGFDLVDTLDDGMISTFVLFLLNQALVDVAMMFARFGSGGGGGAGGKDRVGAEGIDKVGTGVLVCSGGGMVSSFGWLHKPNVSIAATAGAIVCVWVAGSNGIIVFVIIIVVMVNIIFVVLWFFHDLVHNVFGRAVSIIAVATLSISSQIKMIQFWKIEIGRRLDSLVMITLQMVNPGMSGGIHPLGHHVMHRTRSFPVASISLVGSKDNQEGRGCHQGSNRIGMSQIVSKELVLVFHEVPQKQKDGDTQQTRQHGAIHGRSMNAKQ